MVLEIPRTPGELPVSEARYIGTPMKRVEDPLLLTGRAMMIDDVELPGMIHCAILRSPHAHARIKSIDVSEAQKVPGVIAIVTGEDGARWCAPGMSPLPTDKVRFVGEPVAAVAATSRYIAEDAVERIQVEYEPLEVVPNAIRAEEPDAPLVFEEKGTNVIWHRELVWGDVDKALREADYVFTDKFRWNRTSGTPMETFGVITQWDPVDESLTIHGPLQMPVTSATGAAMALGIAPNKVRGVPYWHGGSFGSKGGSRTLEISYLLSRKAGGRPAKYIEDRLEHLSGGAGQSWDRRYEASLAVNKDGKVTGFKVKLLEDCGASATTGIPGIAALKPNACFTGCYTIPVASYEIKLVASNRSPGALYRGAGPPPHYVVLEQLMDIAAQGIGMDPAEFRRKNFIPPDAFPYEIPSGNVYDSGNYEKALDMALQMVDYEKFRKEQEEARKQGKYIGIGVVTSIEPGGFNWNVVSLAGGAPKTNVTPEGCRISVDPFGKVIAKLGFPHQGQGQYTFVTQLLADFFGIEPGDIRIVTTDTTSAPANTLGPGGSRQAITLTGAVLGAAVLLKTKLAKVAAKVMEAKPEDIELMDGKFQVKGVPGAEMKLTEVVGVMVSRLDLLPEDVDPNPETTYVYNVPGRTLPDEQGRCKSYITSAYAIHIPIVEVDVETGKVDILRYIMVDDCGFRLNPATVEGIQQGGMAMGLGAALLEEYVYDDQAQMLSSTFMDYLLPTIYEIPMTEKGVLVTPSPFTGLGAKGTGEGAIHIAPTAILSAINDALRPFGVRINETPASPQRLWNLIQSAKPK